MDKNLYIIDSHNSGSRLDKFLFDKFGFQNSLIQKWIRKKFIKLNGKNAKYNSILYENDAVEIPNIFIINYQNNNNTKLPGNKIDLIKYKNQIDFIKKSIIYKDDNLIILNKPHGIPVQGGKGINFHIAGILSELRFGNGGNPLIVHRIDRDTSGILVLARTKEMSKYMFNLFKNHEIKKHYIALVCNFNSSIKTNGIINKSLKSVEDNNTKKVIIDDSGKDSLTYYEVYKSNGEFAHINLFPKTGRTHQLRVHLSGGLGLNIVGDYKYGYHKKTDYGINQNYMYLHAYNISFISIDGKDINVSASLPTYFNEGINKLDLV